MIKQVVTPLARHLAAIVVAAIVAAGIDPEMEIGQYQEAITGVFVIILLAVYAVLEKLAKPLWRRYFGEHQDGDVPPQAPPKTA